MHTCLVLSWLSWVLTSLDAFLEHISCILISSSCLYNPSLSFTISAFLVSKALYLLRSWDITESSPTAQFSIEKEFWLIQVSSWVLSLQNACNAWKYKNQCWQYMTCWAEFVPNILFYFQLDLWSTYTCDMYFVLHIRIFNLRNKVL